MHYFRKELWFPKLFKRQTIEEWNNAGGKMIHQVAHDRVLEILSKAGPVNLFAGADAELERAFNRARQWSAA